MKTIAILDGDLIAYRCAAVIESRSIKVTHKVTGQETTHAHRTAFKAHIKDKFEEEEFDVVDVQTAKEIAFAYQAMKVTINSLINACGTSAYEVCLSGDNNFRDDLPLPSKYKGSRADMLRPITLRECKEWLIKNHKAIRVDGREADDILAQRAFEGLKSGDKLVQVTIDKDANGCMGWLYNWNKMSAPELIKGLGSLELDDKNKLSGKGRKWFYVQWVLGDPTDCYKPCELSGKKFGEMAAYKLLKDCTTDKECVEAVYKQYKTWYPKPVTYAAWDGKEHTKDVVEIMDMYAACAHMKRWDDDVFDTRKLLDKLGIAHD